MTTDLQKRESSELARPASIYDVFKQMALDPAIDVSRIAALMDLQIKAEDRNAEKEFKAAFARLQPRLPKVDKNGIIDMGAKGSMKFTTYEDLDAAIRPFYTEEGFSITFISEATDKGILLVAELMHNAGHSKHSRMQLPADTGAGRNALQALGSSLSYAKRYLTEDLFNIIRKGQDNDGNGISSLTEKECQNIEDFIHELGEDVRPKLLDFLGYKAVSDIQRAAYRAAIGWLSAKRRQMGAKEK